MMEKVDAVVKVVDEQSKVLNEVVREIRRLRADVALLTSIVKGVGDEETKKEET